MDKNQFENNDEIKPQKKKIDGQMSYDEILVPNNKNEETPKNVTLNGQSDMFDVLKKLDAQIKATDKFSKKTDSTLVENSANDEEKPKRKRKSKKSSDVSDEKTGTIIYSSIDEVMHNSMIPYTEHVVLDRALPRVEDGLKPVQRRILYSMFELGVLPDKQYRKSARIVGDCMGKYHPHGDSSVYDAMVRMSQDFSLREPLVKGHGNFGSIDGDSAAAMRYTEAKLTPLAMELLKDLEKDTVKWSYNFDDTLKEPDMLPGRFPNLLVNGATGIAVGVATNIPPHNLEEVINGVVAYIADNKITLEEMMTIIKAPDFPTGGIIIAGEELKEAYTAGRGKIILRAKVEFERDSDKKQIVITEIPYQVNKATLLQKIVELKQKEKDKLAVITDIRDESDRTGLRAVIKLKKEANEVAILEYLYKNTQLQISYNMNMVAIADGKPKQLGLMEIISYYVEYQRKIVLARTVYDLNIAKERAHIVEGLLIAIKNIDEVIRIIKKSENVSIAKQSLTEKFSLTEKQVVAILDMRLARLVNLETIKLQDELKQLLEQIKHLQSIVDSKAKQYSVVKNELLEIKKQYGNARKSFVKKVEDISVASEFTQDHEEAFAKEIMIALTAGGTIKQMPIKNYSLSQKEITNSSTLFDVHTLLFKTMTNSTLLLFTNMGNCAKIVAGDIAEAKWREKGMLFEDLVKHSAIDEKVVAIFELTENTPDKKMYIYTKRGYIKSINFADCLVNKNYYSVHVLKENDEVICVEQENESQTIIMVTKRGNAINFAKNEIPCQSRNAGGVLGINIDEDDFVLEARQTTVKGSVTIVSENGWAKKMPIGELNITGRYRKGISVIKFQDNAENLIYAKYSDIASDVVLMKQTKLILVGQRNITYDARGSKGKQIAKGKFLNAYNYEV